MKYQNPIIPGFYPDPSICVKDSTFYLINSTFEYLPGIPISESKNLTDWQPIGHCITRDSQIHMPHCRCSGGIFAPTLRYHMGVFFMITTNIDKGTFILTTEDIYKEWSEPVEVAIDGYDPSLFFDEDDRAYIQIAKKDEIGLAIYQSEIDVYSGKLLGDLSLLWRGSGGRDPEGPHIFKRGRYYYLSIAEGGTREGHMITIARSKKLWGPYEPCPRNPVLTNREEADNPLQAIGHADYFTDPHGNWWAVGLCQRPVEHFFHHLGRETFLVPVVWDKDDWPCLGVNGHVFPQMDGPLPSITLNYEPNLYDDFNSLVLDYQWMFMRSFLKKNYDLAQRQGWLHLAGNHITVDELDSPVFIFRRQQHFNCSFKTMLAVRAKKGEEAGLCIYYDNEHHFELTVTLLENDYYIILRKNVADIKVITDKFRLMDIGASPEEGICLEIRSTWDKYYFNFGNTKACEHNLGYTMTKHLSTEAAYSDFVGVVCGMYACSHNPKAIVDAYFDWFEYRPEAD